VTSKQHVCGQGGEELRCGFCRQPLALTGDACSDRPELKIGRCAGCGLTQVSDFTHVATEHYSSSDYFPSDLAAARARERSWNRKRVARVREMIPRAPAMTALDFGCGHGGFLEQAQGVFGQLIGYDLSPRVCQAHREAGWPCVNRLEDAPRDVSVILLFHVLEHLRAPWECLARLQAQFPEAETFVLEVPNENEALQSLFDVAAYRPVHYTSDHVYYFTPNTLRRVAEAAGLAVVVDTQLQRYTLANTLGWLRHGKGGGQDQWDFLNDERLNQEYERVLTAQGVADSVFFICRRSAGPRER